MIPFVWGDYDKNNTYNIDDWQRVNRFEDLEHRIKQLRNDAFAYNETYRIQKQL